MPAKTAAAAKPAAAQRAAPAAVQARGEPLAMPMRGAAQGLQAGCACGGGCPRCSSAALQRKPRISVPGDRFEREADDVADRVMGMAPPPRATISPVAVQRKCKSCDEESGNIQREAVPDGPGMLDADAATQAAQGDGVPLGAESRSWFEPRFGRDLGDVRVHSGPAAALGAQAVQARAYTLGRDIVFAAGEYAPHTASGRRLLAHELVHVMQQQAADAPAEIHRQAAGDPPRPGGDVAPQGQAPQSASAQAAAQGTQAVPPQRPQRQWTPSIPYIWFDLHDTFRASAAPQGPYLYSSFKYFDRAVNPNFENNLNPGPARAVGTPGPGGWPANRSDLLWFFYTKFFVDAADAQLPPQYTRFETSADIRFLPSAGGTGFSYQFTDNSPGYISPGTLSFPMALSTQPYGFRAQDVITAPGTLQWDARLLVAYADDRIPLAIDFVPPPGMSDTAALDPELASRGVRWRDPLPGEAASRYRVSYTQLGTDRFDIHIDGIGEDGAVVSSRTVNNATRADLLPVAALLIAIYVDVTGSGGSSAGRRHVEIRGSQRVPFGLPSAGQAAAPGSQTPSQP